MAGKLKLREEKSSYKKQREGKIFGQKKEKSMASTQGRPSAVGLD